MRVLVTGHRGLIGTEVCSQLRASDVAVVGLDLLGTGQERGDVANAETVLSAVDGVDVVVHLGACSRPMIAEANPTGSWLTNVVGTENVLKAAERIGAAVIYASSREVYGKRSSREPVAEEAELAPVNEYGRQKAECERLVMGAAVPSAVVRFSNVYGSTADCPDRVIPAFLRAALAGETLQVQGPDSAFDFTHVRDAARLVVQLVGHMTYGSSVPSVLNCCTGRATTLLELAKLCCAVAGGGTIQTTAPRARDPSWFCGNTDRAARFGWRYQIELEDGIRMPVEQELSALQAKNESH